MVTLKVLATFKKVTKSGREVGRGPEFHIYLNKIFTYVGETHAL